MEGFSYVDVTDVEGLVKGTLSLDRKTMLEHKLISLSAQLSAWFPGLRARFEQEEPGSDLRGLVIAMVAEAGRKFINNPDGMSSETIGVFAYSRFDTEDPNREPFSKRDLEALTALMEAGLDEHVGNIAIKPSSSMLAHSPMAGPGNHTNRFKRWGRR